MLENFESVFNDYTLEDISFNSTKCFSIGSLKWDIQIYIKNDDIKVWIGFIGCDMMSIDINTNSISELVFLKQSLEENDYISIEDFKIHKRNFIINSLL